MRDINVAQSLCKNIFSINEYRATRKSNNSNIKNSIQPARCCFDKNFYYVIDLLVLMNIKREILMSQAIQNLWYC